MIVRLDTPYKVKETEPLTAPRANEIWVRTNDDVHKVAGDIIDMLGYDSELEKYIDVIDIACIGAGCLNQAIKAIAVARERFGKDGYDLVMQPFFSSFTDDQQRARTRIVLRVGIIDTSSPDLT